MFAFLYYAGSFITVVAIVVCQSNLFWDCANGFVNIFNVHNYFNATNNFIFFSKSGSNGCNKNAILTSSFLYFLIKPKPDVRVKIIPLAIFFLIDGSTKHLQRPTPHHDINVCIRSHFF